MLVSVAIAPQGHVEFWASLETMLPRSG